jgi:hypothetical protein
MFIRALCAFGLMALLVAAGGAVSDDKPKDKDKDKPLVGALPPHALDSAFDGPDTTKGFDEGLLNNDHYKKAVKAALKAKADAIEAKKKNPDLVGPSPQQAARKAFLEALTEAK